jgi:hypothetical protein
MMQLPLQLHLPLRGEVGAIRAIARIAPGGGSTTTGGPPPEIRSLALAIFALPALGEVKSHAAALVEKAAA